MTFRIKPQLNFCPKMARKNNNNVSYDRKLSCFGKNICQKSGLDGFHPDHFEGTDCSEKSAIHLDIRRMRGISRVIKDKGSDTMYSG